MISMKLTGILILITLIFSFHSCKTDDIILHGEIQGFVTDAISGEPVDSATVTLNQSNYSAITGNDGNYLLKNLVPGQYEINVTKSGYSTSKTLVNVGSAKTQQIDFPLYFTAIPNISVSYLDFGIDSTQLSFTISNTGQGNLIYSFTPSQTWISVNHPGGNLAKNQTDSITVTVNKNELSDTNIYMETIQVTLIASHDEIPERIMDVYVNGVMDIDTNYYKVVKIGTQTWMAENLRVGTPLSVSNLQSDNGIIEYYTYDYATYGGFYQWDEMMQYSSYDNGITGTTKGICPDGWHIPTIIELDTLFSTLKGAFVAGGKLKEKGFAHWDPPNEGATNESRFSALPGGLFGDFYNDFDGIYRYVNIAGCWWTSSKIANQTDVAYYMLLMYDNPATTLINVLGIKSACSVRCIKNPGKR